MARSSRQHLLCRLVYLGAFPVLPMTRPVVTCLGYARKH
jgi:hypothetical protein